MTDDEDLAAGHWDLAARQARWRSRRGLLELDLLLPEFVAKAYLGLDARLKAVYGRLLDCEDQDIWDWYRGHSAPEDAELIELIELIRTFHKP